VTRWDVPSGHKRTTVHLGSKFDLSVDLRSVEVLNGRLLLQTFAFDEFFFFHDLSIVYPTYN